MKCIIEGDFSAGQVSAMRSVRAVYPAVLPKREKVTTAAPSRLFDN